MTVQRQSVWSRPYVHRGPSICWSFIHSSRRYHNPCTLYPWPDFSIWHWPFLSYHSTSGWHWRHKSVGPFLDSKSYDSPPASSTRTLTCSSSWSTFSHVLMDYCNQSVTIFILFCTGKYPLQNTYKGASSSLVIKSMA